MPGLLEVKIGFAAPLTGDQAIVGVPMSQCAELAVAQANERRMLPFQLTLQCQDDQADPDVARAVARRFIADPAVIGVIGHKNSGPSGAAAPLYHAAGLTQIAPSSTNPQLSQQGYRTFFRLCAHDVVQGRTAAQYAVRTLGARSIAVLHDQTAYGEPLAQVVRAAAAEEGADVVLFEGITEGAKAFDGPVARIKQLAPDLVYFALTEIESSILARQLREAEVEAALFGTDGSKESKFLSLAGAAGEGTYQTYAGVDPDSTPSAQPFVRAFTDRYGAVPVYGAEVYDAALLLIEALARARHPDRNAVLEEVRRIGNFEGVTGPISFDSNGDRVDPHVTIWRVENGGMALLGSARALIPAATGNN